MKYVNYEIVLGVLNPSTDILKVNMIVPKQVVLGLKSYVLIIIFWNLIKFWDIIVLFLVTQDICLIVQSYSYNYDMIVSFFFFSTRTLELCYNVNHYYSILVVMMIC